MKLHHNSFGQGHPLIILHGLFGSLNNWRTVGRALADQFAVYTVDQRNHGASPHSIVHTHKALASDVLEFMDTHTIASAHLIGHSMGGKAAMEFALSHPERTDRLVVVDISPRQYSPRHEAILNALDGIDVSSYTDRTAIDGLLADRIPEASVRQFLLTNLKRDEHGRFYWRMGLEALRNNYGNINSGIETGRMFEKPTLFIRGGRSKYIQDVDGPRIKQLFPRAVITTIKKASHWVHADAPAEFVKIVRHFLCT